MAITSELIGKLGGGSDVQHMAISFTGKVGDTVLGTATIQSGTTHLLVLIGTFDKVVQSYTNIHIEIGGVAAGRPANGSKNVSVARVVTSTSDLVLVNDSVSANAFTGIMYLVDITNL